MSCLDSEEKKKSKIKYTSTYRIYTDMQREKGTRMLKIAYALNEQVSYVRWIFS